MHDHLHPELMHHHHHHRRPMTLAGLLICVMALLAISYSITLRVIPNAMGADLLGLLGTSPQELNNLNIIYQYSLITSLVLSGLFVDIVGPRTVLVVAIAIAIICNYLFAHTDSINVLLDSRILIGYSHPFILTAVLTMGTHWLPRRHFSLFVGVLFGLLLMTPVVVYPIIHAIPTVDTLKNFIFMINALGVAIIFSILFTERITDKTRHRHDLAGLFKPLSYYKVWLICLVAMLGWMSNTFLLHYGPFYLVSHYNFGVRSAIDTVDTSFTCFGVGAIFMGMISDMFTRRRRYLMAGGYLLAALMYIILFYVPHLSSSMVAILIFLAAFFTSSTIICFSKASDYCAIGNSGITLGLVFSLTAIGSSLFAKVTGRLIKAYLADPVAASSVNWDNLLILVPLLLIFGAVISATLLKPTQLEPITPLPPREIL
jgi:predicted MFS family arabinose efflux permease